MAAQRKRSLTSWAYTSQHCMSLSYYLAFWTGRTMGLMIKFSKQYYFAKDTKDGPYCWTLSLIWRLECQINDKLEIPCHTRSMHCPLANGLSKACDYLPHDRLQAKMEAYGFSIESLSLLHVYRIDRKQSITKTLLLVHGSNLHQLTHKELF